MECSTPPCIAKPRPLIIGVTGGMASGKSTLARMIAGRGILHFDADKIVHQLMRHDREMIAEIRKRVLGKEGSRGWGLGIGDNGATGDLPPPQAGEGTIVPTNSSIPNPQSPIPLAVLAAHITRHPEALAVLEAIIHPRVRAAEMATIEAATRNRLRAVVLDIPLLFETDAEELCDMVIVAHAPLAHRRRRAFARTGMTEEKWQRLLSRQLQKHHRHPAADIVLPTHIGKAALRRRIHGLMKTWGLV